MEVEGPTATESAVEELRMADPGGPWRGRVREAVAARRTQPVSIDGRLDDEAWKAASVHSGFIQKEPQEGAPAAEDTEVRILFDEEALYVGALLRDREPDRIARQLVRRDDEGNADLFEISLDPNLDRRTGYQFAVSAANVQIDKYLFDDEREDRAWNAVWESAVSLGAEGWSVEVRIPLSQLRYEAMAGPQSWGVNFSRRRLASNERSFFAPESRGTRAVVSQFGLLDGIEAERASRRVEIRPYLLSRGILAPADPANPLVASRTYASQFGVDLRYGLGSAFTLDLTVNPDFGQVESDPAVINLTAFETFLDERRPFFVEDARILDFTLSGRQNSLFYSRRIGRAPQGRSPSDATFAERPEASTILGAAKVTGRTTGGLSLGVLAALTGEEEGRAWFAESGREAPFLAEPRTGYGVVRLQQDLRGGQTVVGGIATLLSRALPGDGTFDFLPSTAFSGGVDWEHTWKDREWALTGFAAASGIRGDSTAMIRIQRSSTHYRQRPDATRLSVDSTRTSLGGAEWRLQLERRTGKNWNGAIWAAQVTPGFEVNDLGYSSASERLDGGARLSYRDLVPNALTRSWFLSLSTFHNVSHEVLDAPGSWDSWRAAHMSGSVNLNGNVTFLNYWNLNVDFRASPDTWDRTATRGGPLVQRPASAGGGIRIRSDGRRTVSVAPGFSWGQGRDGSRELSLGMELRLRPSSRIEMEIEPRWGRSLDPAQYVMANSALPWAPTGGSRYLFAELDRANLSMQTRVNVAFTPSMSLQLFAQPLLSSGDYRTYRQLLRGRSFEFDDFEEGTHRNIGETDLCVGGRSCLAADRTRHLDVTGDGTSDWSFSDRDFNVRSLRGNAVFRWEYRPGSTLFLVWQHQRLDEAVTGNFRLSRDLGALRSAPAQNVFIAKLNYWVGL